jgi:hypothetical protein
MIRILFIVITLAFSMSLFSQTKFATAELQEINGLLVNTQKVPNLEIIKRFDADSVVVHLGYKLFPDTVKQVFPSPIYDFVERYTLYVSLLNLWDRNQKMQDDRVKFQFQSLWLISDSIPFTIESNTKEYFVTWRTFDSVQVAEIVFPKNFQLIQGLNLIESDSYFKNSVTTYSDTTYEQVKFLRCNVETIDSMLFVEKGHDFEGASCVNSNKYFTLSEDSNYVVAVEKTDSIETYLPSVFNFLTTENYNLNVTQTCYGNKKICYKVPMRQVTAYCVHQNCEPYIGIESDDGKVIKAVVIYENHDYNYNHLLCLDISHDVLKNKNGDIDCRIFSYIPTFNLKNK